jgi:hypothetical protein
MKFRFWFTLLVLILVIAVAALNVAALVTPVDVDLLVATVRLPLWPIVVGVPVLLAVVFLVGGMLDRSRQLRQTAALERQLADARATIDRGRESALDDAVHELKAELGVLESKVEGVASGMESRLGERLAELEARRENRDGALDTRLAELRERVTRVRDELAADVAEAEDAILRALPSDDRTVEATPPALPPERG